MIMIENFKIIGINHKCSTKEYRALFFQDNDSIFQVLKYLFLVDKIEYSLILNTSNRTEFHILTERNDINEILKELFKKFNLPNYEYFKSISYNYQSINAIKHLFRVIASIDSEKLGDNQIISQVRNAFHISDEIRNHNFMHRLLNAAIRASSTVRANTAIGIPIKSIAGTACTYILDICRKDDKIMFYGYDNDIKTIAIKLFEKGFTKLSIYPDMEVELPEQLKCFVVSSLMNNSNDTIAIITNKEFTIDKLSKSIKLVIDLGNSIKQNDNYVKYVTQSTLCSEIESAKLEKLNSIEVAENIIIKEVSRFEKHCNEDYLSS